MKTLHRPDPRRYDFAGTPCMREIQGQFRRREKEVESATRIGRSGTVRSCDGPRVDRSRSKTPVGLEESTLSRVHTNRPMIHRASCNSPLSASFRTNIEGNATKATKISKQPTNHPRVPLQAFPLTPH